mgnify:CR=1 FL=1
MLNLHDTRTSFSEAVERAYRRIKKNTNRLNIGFSQSVKVNYRTGARNPDGSVIWLRDWDHNLILDGGLNSYGVRQWPNCFTYAAVGSGTNPVERDSGATTFTASAGTITASAGFFEAGDTGRLFRADSGEQGYLTYVNTTSCTWTGPDFGAASPGTVWYVNRTALQTEIKRTNTYRAESGDNFTTWTGATSTLTMQRTFLFTAEVGAVTYREVGWSWGSGATPLFGMDVFSGGGDTLAAGQQYLIAVQLIVTVSPTSPTTAPNVGTGGWNTEGDISIGTVAISGGIAGVDTNGSSNGQNNKWLDASTTYGEIWVATAPFTLPTATTSPVTGPAGLVGGSITNLTYTSGTFYRDKQSVFSVLQGNNGTIYGICLGSGPGATLGLAVKFDTPQAKDAEHTLTVTFRISWQRNFS